MPAESMGPAARRTRERILETTLALYNQLGEPQVSTTLIAAEVGISPGNLHYHFRKKDELTGALLDRFVREIEELLPPAGWRADHVEDAWFLLHVVFETIWKHRFLFRDLTGMMSRDRRVGLRLTRLFGRVVDAARGICLGLAAGGSLEARPAGIEALANNVAVVTLYWLSFDTVRHPRREQAGEAIEEGVYQVLMLVAPFMLPAVRVNLEYLAGQYLPQRPPT